MTHVDITIEFFWGDTDLRCTGKVTIDRMMLDLAEDPEELAVQEFRIAWRRVWEFENKSIELEEEDDYGGADRD